jgi:subtilisin family serine protease
MAFDKPNLKVLRAFQINKARGYVGVFSKAEIRRMRTMPEISNIEPDQIIYLQQNVVQQQAHWGLVNLNNGTCKGRRFTYNPNDGADVRVYVLDTGIDAKSKEFGNRVQQGRNLVKGEGPEDLNGHGTHVA